MLVIENKCRVNPCPQEKTTARLIAIAHVYKAVIAISPFAFVVTAIVILILISMRMVFFKKTILFVLAIEQALHGADA